MIGEANLPNVPQSVRVRFSGQSLDAAENSAAANYNKHLAQKNGANLRLIDIDKARKIGIRPLPEEQRKRSE